jgi:hypothetical protein
MATGSKDKGNRGKAEVRDVEATATMPARRSRAAAERRGRGRPAGPPAGTPAPKHAPDGVEAAAEAAGQAGSQAGTEQVSIRMSAFSDQTLDRLVEYLNEIREAGTEPWTRTQVLELALRDWWPAWLAGRRAIGPLPEMELPECLQGLA